MDLHRPSRRRARPGRVLLLAALVACLVAAAAWWSTIVAQARAVVVLATLLDVPVLSDATEAVTDEPRVDRDARLAGQPVTIVRPGSGSGPWPGLLFITGADAGGREQQDVVRLAGGLARAGFVVFVPDLPGMRDGEIGPRSLDTARQVTIEAARMPDVREEQIALASVSAGAAIALVIAADERVEPHVSVVAGVAPYADARTVLEIATLGEVDGERFESTEWLQTAIARSLFTATAGPPHVERLERDLLDEERPIDALRAVPASRLDGASHPVLALLRSRSASEFASRYQALPQEILDQLRALSPIHVAIQLDMPIELASAPRDKYFPLRESQAIVDAAPDARLTTTSTLEHAIPDASLTELDALAAFDAFIVRVLRHAADPDGR